MLKIRKSKVKVVSIITFLSLLSVSYVGLSFYSIPEKVSAADSNGVEEWRTLSDITYMQEMTIDICNNTKTGIGKSLQDKRNGSEYYIQKLTDNNCWMLQNLELTREGIIAWKKEHPDDNNNVELSSEYSNVAENSSFEMPNTISSLNSGDKSQFGEDTHYNSTAQIYDRGNSSSNWQGGYGAYYNWYAATAGTGDNSVLTSGTDVDSSVCSKGWRLPTSYKTDTSTPEYKYSFNQLVIDPLTGNPYAISGDVNYEANAWKSTNYTNVTLGLTNASGAVLSDGFFPAAGYVQFGSLSSISLVGYYWSNTALLSSHAYALYFSRNELIPSNLSALRYRGLSVRCVANPDIHSDPVPPTDERHTDVAVRVGPTISIDAVTSLYGEVDYTKVLEDNITATVSSNNAYQLLLSAEQTSLLDPAQPNNTGIPTLATTKALEKNTNAWGIYSGNIGETAGTEADPRTYAPITASPSKHYYYNLPPDENMAVTSVFGIGITVSAGLPNGTYSTNVTVTAVNA